MLTFLQFKGLALEKIYNIFYIFPSSFNIVLMLDGYLIINMIGFRINFSKEIACNFKREIIESGQKHQRSSEGDCFCVTDNQECLCSWLIDAQPTVFRPQNGWLLDHQIGVSGPKSTHHQLKKSGLTVFLSLNFLKQNLYENELGAETDADIGILVSLGSEECKES